MASEIINCSFSLQTNRGEVEVTEQVTIAEVAGVRGWGRGMGVEKKGGGSSPVRFLGVKLTQPPRYVDRRCRCSRAPCGIFARGRKDFRRGRQKDSHRDSNSYRTCRSGAFVRLRRSRS